MFVFSFGPQSALPYSMKFRKQNDYKKAKILSKKDFEDENNKSIYKQNDLGNAGNELY
jgi:hypothetical protein